MSSTSSDALGYKMKEIGTELKQETRGISEDT